MNEIGVTLDTTWFVSRRFIGSRRDVCIDRTYRRGRRVFLAWHSFTVNRARE